jgi:FtsP/CotA-like multicopper oxidase with cupredoxin domain
VVALALLVALIGPVRVIADTPPTPTPTASEPTMPPGQIYRGNTITAADREAAAERLKEKKRFAPADVVPAQAQQGGVPDYFDDANWAFSPMPTSGATVTLEGGGGTGATGTALVVDGVVQALSLTAGGSGYTSAPAVTIEGGAGTGAAGTADISAAVASIAVDNGGAGYTAATVDITGGGGTGASAAATIDAGVITAINVTAGGSGYTSAPAVVINGDGAGAAATATVSGSVTGLTLNAGGSGYMSGGLRKFVDELPGLGPDNQNALGQYIPVAVADQATFDGADYYEIAVVEYDEQMHSDLPPTRTRGYVQLSTALVPGAQVPLVNPDGSPIMMPDGLTQALGVDIPHYLGPTIVATRDVPVRIKFYNLLPTGAGGDLFIPVDKSVMGAGMGPMMGEDYTQNRATVHLHGTDTVWISDGTPHQWITPADETTSYPEGVSVIDVPDMPASEPGTMTFYYTNQMSARLQFYHDHSFGITRLNVYAGEAAGYVLTDEVEQDLIDGTNNSGVNPGGLEVLPGLGIPLVIQDRTFVDATTVLATDPTWNWGTGALDPNTGFRAPKTGDLWYPHIYVPAQNPWDESGANAYGRWHFGPWFWPPTDVDFPPIPNPYCLPTPGVDCSDTPWEAPLMPAAPNPSMPGEAFMDTPIVNGTAYPYMEVEPKAYRFRILSAADDRFFNLQLYEADATVVTPDGRTDTEVTMIPATGVPGIPADFPSGVPDPTKKGPQWIQIGTEGGFLPKPAVIEQQHISWDLNPTAFAFGNVVDHSLLLAPAERADVIVDFSAFAGKTLILYNDAPAAFPALDPRYDYYTGNPDQQDTGGSPSTIAGFGPNTRTVMQIRVGTDVTTPTTDVTLSNLEAVFAKAAGKRGVFEVSQDPPVMPSAEYNSAYGVTNLPTAAANIYVRLHEFSKTFRPINALGVLQPPVTLALEPKAIQDEMGEAFDTQYGRMSGMLGLELPTSSAAAQQFNLYPYLSPPVDLMKGIPDIQATQIGALNDGTQIWKINHNGVDTHPIHTHLFNAQLVNRVAWDGAMKKPDANELGWKETFRVNPLEQTIIAFRPKIPQVPFEVPNSIRLLDPTKAEGEPLVAPPPAGWFDPLGNQIEIPVLNHYVNFGWEYVYHCHILAHEEMDMMHSVGVAVPPRAPINLNLVTESFKATLTWTDDSNTESGFRVDRANAPNGPWTTLATYPEAAGSGTVLTHVDNTYQWWNLPYYYRVVATVTIGDPTDYAGSQFPLMSAESAPAIASAGVVETAMMDSVTIGSEVAIFAATAAGELQYRETTGGVFGDWVTVGGGVASTPEPVMLGSDLYVFFRGTANDAAYYLRSGGVWSGPISLGGVIVGYPEAAVNPGTGDLEMVMLNGADQIWSRVLSGGTWSGWTLVSGLLHSGLELEEFGAGLQLVGINVSGQTWTREKTATWGAWVGLNGTLRNDPTASVFGGNLFVFGDNAAGVTWYRALDGASTWGPWTNLGGIIGGSPAATSTTNQLLITGVGPAGQAWYRSYDGATWSPWASTGGSFTTGPEAAASGATAWLFAVDASHAVSYSQWNGTSWSAWTSLGGAVAYE